MLKRLHELAEDGTIFNGSYPNDCQGHTNDYYVLQRPLRRASGRIAQHLAA